MCPECEHGPKSLGTMKKWRAPPVARHTEDRSDKMRRQRSGAANGPPYLLPKRTTRLAFARRQSRVTNGLASSIRGNKNSAPYLLMYALLALATDSHAGWRQSAGIPHASSRKMRNPAASAGEISAAARVAGPLRNNGASDSGSMRNVVSPRSSEDLVWRTRRRVCLLFVLFTVRDLVQIRSVRIRSVGNSHWLATADGGVCSATQRRNMLELVTPHRGVCLSAPGTVTARSGGRPRRAGAQCSTLA